MRKVCLAALATLAFTGAASAQEGLKPIGISLRAGLFTPLDADAREGSGGWFAFGAQYPLFDLPGNAADPEYRASVAFSVDYYGRGGFRNVPVLLNYVGRKNELFYSAGLGVGFTNVGDEDKARFAYQVGLGYEFGNGGAVPFFVEGKFFGSEKSDLNGFGIYLGVRL